MDQFLDSLGKERVYFLFDSVSSFHQLAAHKNTVRLTTFWTPTDLYEWLVIPQGSTTSPGWFIKAVNEIIKGSEQVEAHLDDEFVFDCNPTSQVKTMRALLERLRTHNLKLSPSKLVWAP